MELLVTVAVLAITLGIAIPSFQELVTRNRLSATTNELVSALALARSEAVKRATPVSVVSADWSAGWEVSVDADGTVLRVYQANEEGGAEVTADTNFSGYVRYLPSGASEGSDGTGSGSFEICKSSHARTVSINNAGRVSTTGGDC